MDASVQKSGQEFKGKLIGGEGNRLGGENRLGGAGSGGFVNSIASIVFDGEITLTNLLKRADSLASLDFLPNLSVVNTIDISGTNFFGTNFFNFKDYELRQFFTIGSLGTIGLGTFAGLGLLAGYGIGQAAGGINSGTGGGVGVGAGIGIGALASKINILEKLEVLTTLTNPRLPGLSVGKFQNIDNINFGRGVNIL
ncbi:hypothetical protein NWP21_17580 [Anabaenopsis sp. FSS-46]|uniref:hypothetical protein n=1 Tax=Anabaenopsis sp. FSS-46 TaxID=2971766 RepID=UPI002474FF5B|nr:hypothetical protein [Anabaenopsis sp. FSS-46]MDH6100616.1 hypothetical protein [Anabaenopsis sp. FSS-46]